VWDFDHLLDVQQGFSSHCRNSEISPQIDLSRGYAAYATGLRESGSDQIKKAANLARRIEREVGPLRFVNHTTDLNLLRIVLDWKSQQYRESGKEDLFTIAWFRAVVERIQGVQTEFFAGSLSVLFAGDKLVAGHMGMRSRCVWHYWFPAYDVTYSKYSPGILLLLQLAEHAASAGITLVDLGKGMSMYKQRLMNSSVSVAVGSVETASWLRCQRATGRFFRKCLVRSGLATPVRAVLRRLRFRK